MGKDKGGDRKGYTASSSAKAAEVLAARASASGFGGFTGARPVAGFGFGVPGALGQSSSSSSGSTEPLLTADLDGDIAQNLRHLSKRDTTTKIKALQSLKELLATKPPAEWMAALPAWVYAFKRALLDPHKSVRAEACTVMAQVVGVVGKALAPHLKPLLGPWWLAAADPYADVAAAARRSLGEAFPGRKLGDALLFALRDVTQHLISCLDATPQSLTTSKTDTPQEMEERHERVLAGAVAGLAHLVNTVVTHGQSREGGTAPGASATSSGGADEGAGGCSDPTQAAAAAAAAAAGGGGGPSGLTDIQEALAPVVSTGAFWKKVLGSKSALVRRSGYTLVKVACTAVPALLGGCLGVAVPPIMGSLQEVEPGNHPAMWDALLALLSAYPTACDHVNLPKAVLPRLWSFLRHGCYGSAASSLPALLPLLALLPQGVVLQQQQHTLLLEQLVSSCWAGLAQVVGQPGKQATVQAVAECLAWGLKSAAALTGDAAGDTTTPSSSSSPSATDGDAAAGSQGVTQGSAGDTQQVVYCRRLLGGCFSRTILPAALTGGGSEPHLAAAAVQRLMQLCCQQGAAAAGGSAAGAAAAAAAAPGGGALPVGAAAGAGDRQQQQYNVPVYLAVLLEVACTAIQGQMAGAGLTAAAVPEAPGAAAAAAAAGADAAAAAAAMLDAEAAGEADNKEPGHAAAASGQDQQQLQQQVCEATLQLLAACSNSSSSGAASKYGAAAAQQLATTCIACLMPVLTAGTVLPPAAVNLLAAALTASAQAPAAAGDAQQYLAPLVDTCLTESVTAGQRGALVKLLLTCVAVSSQQGVAWSKLLQKLAAAAGSATAGQCTAAGAMQLVVDLVNARPSTSSDIDMPQLVRALASPEAVSALDKWAVSVAGQLEQQATSAVAVQQQEEEQEVHPTASHAAGLLLAAVLGANNSSRPLVSQVAAGRVIQSMFGTLAAAVPWVQQSTSTLQPASTTSSASSSVGAGGTMAAAAVVAVVQQLATAGSGSDLGGWSNMVDHHTAAALELLVHVFQLSMGASCELQPPAAGDDSSSVTGTSDSYPSDTEVEGGDPNNNAAAGAGEAGAAGVGGSGGVEAAAGRLGKLRDAAAGAWYGVLAAAAAAELPDAALQHLGQQLLQLVQDGLVEAATAAAAAVHPAHAPEGSCSPAAAEQGQRWAYRAAALVNAWQQQRQGTGSAGSALARQLVGGLLRVSLAHTHVSPSDASIASSSGSSSRPVVAAASSSGGRQVLTAFTAHLALHVGVTQIVDLLASDTGDQIPVRVGPSDARLQMLLELICCCEEEQYGQEGAVAMAAAAAEEYLLDAAIAEEETGQQQLQQALVTLLHAAARSSSSSSSSNVQVLTAAAVGLLKAVAARAGDHVVLQQALQQYMRDALAPAVTSPTAAAAGGSSSSSIPGVVLVCVLPVVAAALRRGDIAAVTGAQLDVVSIELTRRAMQQFDQVHQTPAGGQIQALQLVLACFPVQYKRQAATSSSTAGASGSSTVVNLVGGTCSAAERQALMALVRHVSSATPAGVVAAAATAAAAEQESQLQLSCLAYGWSDMAAAEWHAVLRHLQQVLTAARQDLQQLAGLLAAAACVAAQSVLSGTSGEPAEAMMPETAVALLFKLAAKGLLVKHGAYQQLLAAQAAALAKCSMSGALLPVLQLLAAVLRLQQQIQAGGKAPQLGLALSSCTSEAAAALLAVGACMAVASAAGGAAVAPVLTWFDRRSEVCSCLVDCLDGADEASVMQALEAADARSEMVGVDSVSCLLALLKCPAAATAATHHHHHHHHQQQQQEQQQQMGRRDIQPAETPVAAGRQLEALELYAWRLLLHPRPLSLVTFCAAATAAGDGSDGNGSEDMRDYEDDAEAYLTAVGCRPEMAAGLNAVKPWQPYLLQWALLLSHLQLLARGNGPQQPPAPAAARRLSSALREVPELVPSLLDRLVPLLGLSGRRCGDKATAAAAAAAQVQLAVQLKQYGGASEEWRLAGVLHSVGLPVNTVNWRLTAAALYRAVLLLLPASARSWFSDLRDRGTAAAVEGYTLTHESPALLAAEFAAVRRAGAGDRLGGGDSSIDFKVKANAAAREVAAVLDIEDGAQLELLVRLPAAAPLRPAEVECKNTVGVNEGRLRKWLLSIAVFLRAQNQGVVDALDLWRSSVDAEFRGVQPCLICYSVISSANGQLPRLSCRQCSITFHPACLYKWFKSSGKSQCPHCQAPW